jgi:hypothetical protein
MNPKNQMGVQSLNDVTFSQEPNVGSMIVKIIGFVLVMIVEFDPHAVEVGDLAVSVMHSGFFMKTTIWIKIRKGANGRRWTINQKIRPYQDQGPQKGCHMYKIHGPM